VLVLSLAAIGVVIGFNGALVEIAKIIAHWTKPHTISLLETTTAQLIFLAQYINTGLLILITNTDFKAFPAIADVLPPAIANALPGKQVDFDSTWYTVVGSTIVGQSISAAVAPNFTQLSKWPREWVKTYILKNRQYTQRQLNKLFEGAAPRLARLPPPPPQRTRRVQLVRGEGRDVSNPTAPNPPRLIPCPNSRIAPWRAGSQQGAR
jgi:hypothetical protein